jgi:hypothetical protein
VSTKKASVDMSLTELQMHLDKVSGNLSCVKAKLSLNNRQKECARDWIDDLCDEERTLSREAGRLNILLGEISLHIARMQQSPIKIAM